MPDLHQVVDQIRAIVQSNDQTRSVLLDGLSSAYAQACGEVNQRLGRCHRLLQQGLRSEAIQLAETEPKLLDASAALDFPERATWDELVAVYNLTPAARILVDAAQFLNQAYAEQEPLADLLRTHRRLALSRSPLGARISVIRQLAAQDPNNLIWADDLRTFEQARFREIQDEAAEAVRVRDATRLAKFIEELQGHTWSQQPPKGLLPRLAKAEAELRGLATRTALAEVEVQLNEAFAARDPILGRNARKTWEKLVSTGALGPDDPARKRVEPVFEWLDELDRHDRAEREYNDALTGLTRLLEEPRFVPPRTLERAARAVLDHGRGMAEDIQRRYVARVQEAEATQKRRFWIIAGSSAAASLVAVWLSYSFIRGVSREWAAEDAERAIRKLIDPRDGPEGGLKKAEDYLATIARDHPDLLTHPLLREAQADVQSLRDAHDRKEAEFEDELRKLEHARLDNDDIASKKRLNELAGTDPSKQQRTANIVRQRRQIREQEEGRAVQTVGRLLQEAETHIEQARQSLDARSFDNIPEIQGHLDKAERSLHEVSRSPKGAGADFQRRENLLQGQLEALERSIAALKHRSELVQQISEALSIHSATDKTTMDRFAHRLAGYLEAFPAERESAEVKRTLENERPIWEAISEWNTLVAEWQADLRGFTPQIAAARAEQCKRFLEKHPLFPDAINVDAFRRHAEAIRKRESRDNRSPKTKLKKLFGDFTIEDAYMVTVTSNVDGKPVAKTYYGPKEWQTEGTRLTFKRYLKTTEVEKGDLRLDLAKDEVKGPVLSPQSKIAAEFKGELSGQATSAGWESLAVRMFDAIMGDKEIDAILQVLLLRNVLDFGCEGSEPMRESKLVDEMQTELVKLAKEVAEVNWIDPEERDVERFREKAKDLVLSLGHRPRERLMDQIAERRNSIEGGVRRSYRCVGWLYRGQGWELKGPSLVTAAQDLWVAVPAGQSVGKWTRAGGIDNRRAVLVPDRDPALAEGRPVFVKVD